MIEALADVNFSLKRGDRLGISGKNGSGKTTLLRAVAGCYWPTSGSVKVEGQINSLLDINLGMDENSTGLENIYLRSVFMGLSKKRLRKLSTKLQSSLVLGLFSIYLSAHILRE